MWVVLGWECQGICARVKEEEGCVKPNKKHPDDTASERISLRHPKILKSNMY